MASLEMLRLLEKELNVETATINKLEKQLERSFERRKTILESIFSLTKSLVDASKTSTKGETRTFSEGRPSNISSHNKTFSPQQRNVHVSRSTISRSRSNKFGRTVVKEYVESKPHEENLKKVFTRVATVSEKDASGKLSMRPVVHLEVMKNTAASESTLPSVPHAAPRETSPFNVPRPSNSTTDNVVSRFVQSNHSNDLISTDLTPSVSEFGSLSSEISIFVKKSNQNTRLSTREVRNSTDSQVTLSTPSITTHEVINSATSDNVNGDVWFKSEENLHFSESAADPLEALVDAGGDYVNVDMASLQTSEDPLSVPSNADVDPHPESVRKVLDYVAQSPEDFKVISEVPPTDPKPKPSNKSHRNKSRSSTNDLNQSNSNSINPFSKKKKDVTWLGRYKLHRERLRLKKLASKGISITDQSYIVCYVCEKEHFDSKSFWRSCKICQDRFASPECHGLGARPYICRDCV